MCVSPCVSLCRSMSLCECMCESVCVCVCVSVFVCMRLYGLNLLLASFSADCSLFKMELEPVCTHGVPGEPELTGLHSTQQHC